MTVLGHAVNVLTLEKQNLNGEVEQTNRKDILGLSVKYKQTA